MSEKQFSRLERLIGKEAVERLHSARAVVFGVGAVGGHAFESLVRCGIGNITIVDFDVVEESNINRQIIALHSTVGMEKVTAASQRALDIYPQLKIKAVNAFADSSNIPSLIEGADAVLDCIDTVSSKLEIIRSCQNQGIWMISSMGAALRRDLSQIRFASLDQTSGCPLARALRTRVRKAGLSARVPVVYSPEQVVFDYTQENDERADERRKQISLGSLPTITAAFGQYMAQGAINHILGASD